MAASEPVLALADCRTGESGVITSAGPAFARKHPVGSFGKPSEAAGSAEAFTRKHLEISIYTCGIFTLLYTLAPAVPASSRRRHDESRVSSLSASLGSAGNRGFDRLLHSCDPRMQCTTSSMHICTICIGIHCRHRVLNIQHHVISDLRLRVEAVGQLFARLRPTVAPQLHQIPTLPQAQG